MRFSTKNSFCSLLLFCKRCGPQRSLHCLEVSQKHTSHNTWSNLYLITSSLRMNWPQIILERDCIKVTSHQLWPWTTENTTHCWFLHNKRINLNEHRTYESQVQERDRNHRCLIRLSPQNHRFCFKPEITRELIIVLIWMSYKWIGSTLTRFRQLKRHSTPRNKEHSLYKSLWVTELSWGL